MSVIAQWVSATQDAVILTIGTSIPQNVRVRISESESFDEWRETPTQFIQDPHRVGRFRINDLKPDTTYYYQIYAGGVLDPSRSDQIRTLPVRSEEHTSELQSRGHLVCRLLLEKKKCRCLSSSGWHCAASCVYS